VTLEEANQIARRWPNRACCASRPAIACAWVHNVVALGLSGGFDATSWLTIHAGMGHWPIAEAVAAMPTHGAFPRGMLGG